VLAHSKRYLARYKLYRVASQIRWQLPRIIEETERGNYKVASLEPEGTSQGNVLLSYMNEALMLKPGEPVPNTHISFWKSVEMAKTFLELGYSVDVISFGNLGFVPRKNYSVMIDTRYNFQRLAPFLDKKCLKIMHIDTAHMLFHNTAEANRLLALQQRRGVTLKPFRFETPNLAIEHADCATTCGNEFTINTFRYAGKPIYRLPIPVGVSFPWPSGKDFDACRKRFFWFASQGMVHKGLDLVLEAFTEMPEYQLIICGPVEKEPEFVKVYQKELYRTKSIQTVGWLDTDSRQFTDVVNRCVAHVYTSCSEGGGACVVETMHAGLIPIVSYETSVDVHDFGVMLKSATVEEIKEGVRTIAEMPTVELQRRARKAWEYARENHTREEFAQEYRKTIKTILRTYFRSE